MPTFYNTAAPTPSTKNNINDIAVTYGIRDYLLNLNLAPFYPQYSTAINGSPQIGQPVLDTSINGNANVTPNGLPLEVNGLIYYELMVINNQFQNNEPTSPTLTSIENITTTEGVFGPIDLPEGSSYPTSATDEITELGLLGKTNYANFRTNATLYNLYVDSTSQIDMADFISLQPAGFTQQLSNYFEVFGNLDNGGPSTNDLNVIGSIFNGQGLGFAKGGVIPNFDFRASIAGRTLTGLGVGTDTRLGIIGGQQLALALANNAGFNVQQELLGSLNVQNNILSLIKGDGWAGLRPSYKITIPSTTGGRILDTAGKILGFTIPRSYLDDAGSIFQSENGDSENIDRANEMLKYTGKGQAMALVKNFRASLDGTSNGGVDDPSKSPFRSGYAPAFTNNKGNYADNAISDPNLYAYSNGQGHFVHLLGSLEFGKSNGVIPSLCFERERKTEESGFESPEQLTFVGHRSNLGYDDRKVSDIAFSWGSDKAGLVNTDLDGNYSPITGNKKSLLVKTQALFNDKGMLNIVTRKGDMNKHSSQTQTANGYGFSKGNAVMKADMFDLTTGRWKGEKDKTAEETYCRSWTTLYRYDQVQRLIRNRGLYDNSNVPYRNQVNGSVLDDNGFVKITPYNSARGEVEDPKRYMLSLENLAWIDNSSDLPPYERGNGDPLNPEKKGRIMWFPPYDIQFNETSSVSWEKNDFIGRGESIYTYNNTERTGSLSFKIIVDHPTYVNSFGKRNGTPDDNYVASFFAGCIEADPKFTEKLTVSELSETLSRNITVNQAKVLTPQTPPASFNVYYPNDSPSLDTIINGLNGIKYESGLTTSGTPIAYSIIPMGLGFGIGSYVGGGTSQTAWNDITNFGLNGKRKQSFEVGGTSYSGLTDITYMPALKSYLEKECTYCKVKVVSYASPHGNLEDNQNLATNRTNSVINYLKEQLGLPDNRFEIGENKAIQESETSCKVNSDRSSEPCKIDRRTEVTFVYSEELATQDPKNAATPVESIENTTINTKIINRFYNESNWFEKLKKGDAEKNIPGDYFIFDKFRDKIKYFHPAFHSTTPEGLNSRLTFLHQCTRQGATFSEGQGANNLAFGRAPVCILRVGDFYHTKIVIDNLSIEYEPLVWDLNPEGIGVQPMIANVTLSFKFLGGSSLAGPINKLQNALSFNYYANAHVYDVRADYVKANALVEGQKSLSGAVEVQTSSVIDITPIENQEAANNIENSGPVNDPSVDPSTIQSDAKITGFKFIEFIPTTDFTYSMTLVVYQEGIVTISGGTATFILNEAEFQEFVDKNVKIVVELLENPQNGDRNEFNLNTNDVTALVNGAGYMEEVTVSEGDYSLSIYYDGNKIQSIPVTLNNDVNSKYYF